MKAAVAIADAEPALERSASALAVERAAEILLLLAQTDTGSLSVTELARETKASGSAIHRILTALRRKQLVDQHPETQRYALSWRMLTLFRQMNSRADLRGVVYPYMLRLRDLTAETITLNVQTGFERVCIEAVEGTHEIRWVAQIGQLAPLHSGVTGELLLAYAAEPDRRAYWSHLAQLRKLDPAIPSRAVLVRRVETIASEGYALAQSSHVQGIDAVSAPILGPDRSIAAALTIAGPAERCTLERLEAWLPDLLAAAGEVSQVLDRSASAIRPTTSSHYRR
ncbi:MAG: IclR family transcriptional regulator [Candidatus Dormiibacterota bacterium]